MMNRIFTLLAVAAILCGICTGRTDAMTSVVLEEGAGAIELCIFLTGGMCVWGGLLRVAQKSGLTDRLAACFARPACILFPGLNPKGAALPAITMNFAANLLGLGNAATPLGIQAAQRMSRSSPGRANDELCMLVVCNTASIQLIPTTVATVRAAAGSQTPFDILPAVWLASSLSVEVGICVCKLLSRVWRD